MPFIGTTVRLKAEFKDFGGANIDPTDITLTIYNKNREVIEGPITIDSGNKIDTGIYYFDYVIPEGYSVLVYEFKGMYNNKPLLGRSTITRIWSR